MPSRSPSCSPERSAKPRKHKHRHRSRSPNERKRKKHKTKDKYASEDRDSDTAETHQGNKSDDPRYERPHSSHHRSHARREEDSHERLDLQRVKRERDDERNTVQYRAERPIKREPHDRAYEEHSRRRGDQERGHRAERAGNDQRREDNRRNRNNTAEENWSRPESSAGDDSEPPKDKEKPNFELSGKLTEDANTFRGVVVKYNEPPEARKPRRKWRFYPFKGDEGLPVLHLHRQSAFLMGRDRRVADIPVDHPSCSKQHAVLQFRMVDYDRDDGKIGRRVLPYVIDLNSANGTYINNKRIEPQRYVQLFEKDVIKFGYSTREYVLLYDGVDTSEVQEHDEENDS